MEPRTDHAAARHGEVEAPLAEFRHRAVVRRFQQPVHYAPRAEHTPVGVIVPADFELDWEYWRYLPHQVLLSFTRLPPAHKAVGVSMAKALARPASIWRATQGLVAIEPEAVLYACSSGSFIRGVEGEENIRRTMIEAGAKRAVTTSGAMLDAFRLAGVRKVALATPYTLRLSRALVDFVEEAGYEVVSAPYLGLDRDIAEVSHETIAELVRAASHPEADAVFVSCTSLHTYGIIAMLERAIGVPVFTSNQVSLWGALSAAGALYGEIDELSPDEIPGGARPMARSTGLLLAHAHEERDRLEAAAAGLSDEHEIEEVIVS